MANENQREVILLFGQTGSGKSFLARQIAREYPRVLVADSGFNDYFPIESVSTYQSLLEKFDEWGAFHGKPFRVSYDFRPLEYELPFSSVLYLRDTLLVLEEGDRFDPAMDDYGEVIFRGRHYGASLLVVSLHPRAITTELRRQVTKIISFRQVFPDDLDWLAEVIGEDAYKLSNFTGPPTRPPHPYLIWTPLEGSKIIGQSAQKRLTVKASLSTIKGSQKAPAQVGDPKEI